MVLESSMRHPVTAGTRAAAAAARARARAMVVVVGVGNAKNY